jgi:hypothetical protein
MGGFILASRPNLLRVHARERIPNATAAYLEAYVALELCAHKTQALVDRILKVSGTLTDTGTRLRNDAWKFAPINELPALHGTIADDGRSIRLRHMPRPEQILEAIADWRKKRNYLQQLWDNLPPEVRATLKFPETLD